VEFVGVAVWRVVAGCSAVPGCCAPGGAGVSTGALGPMYQTAGPLRGGSIGMPSGAGSPAVAQRPNATTTNFPAAIKDLASLES
jgi:hypothetical protein